MSTTRRLTKKRAEIIKNHFYPFLEANIEAGFGDLCDTGLLENYNMEDIKAALDWIWRQANNKQEKKLSTTTRSICA